MSTPTLRQAALDVLTTADYWDKATKTRAYAQQWRDGAITDVGTANIPERPARLSTPELRAPTEMPRRRKAGSKQSKIALLHAIAHIELNAVDLAWDIIGRNFDLGGYDLPKDFFNDWVKVADDEAKHFLLVSGRLNDLEAAYGDLPAHDGLWESAIATQDDFAARLAIVPMVLEARGLDVTPAMIEAMQKQKDDKTTEILQIIHDDEITHVAAGTRWFEGWCVHHNKDIEQHWQHLVTQYFNGTLRSPFNHPSREAAGMIRDWYEPLADIPLARFAKAASLFL